MGSGHSKRELETRGGLTQNQRRWLEEQDPAYLAALIASHNGNKGHSGLQNVIEKTPNWQLKHSNHQSKYQQRNVRKKRLSNNGLIPVQNPLYLGPRQTNGRTSPLSTLTATVEPPMYNNNSNHPSQGLHYATSYHNIYSTDDVDAFSDEIDLAKYEMDSRNGLIHLNDEQAAFQDYNQENHPFTMSTNLPPSRHERAFIPRSSAYRNQFESHEDIEQRATSPNHLFYLSHKVPYSQRYTSDSSSNIANTNTNNISTNGVNGVTSSGAAIRHRKDLEIPFSNISRPIGASTKLGGSATAFESLAHFQRPILTSSNKQKTYQHQEYPNHLDDKYSYNALDYGNPKEIRSRKRRNQARKVNNNILNRPTTTPTNVDKLTDTFSALFANSTGSSNIDCQDFQHYKQGSKMFAKISAQAAHYQRGLDYNNEERKQYNILGLLPVAQQDLELQISWVLKYLDENCANDKLNQYIFLRHLKDFNETLFYATLTQNVEKLMPIVYTPVVGLACQKFSSIYMRPRGLFISLENIGQVNLILSNWHFTDVRVIVVTDGERILGLGDLGANGMGISIGKLSLYTALAGVPPKNVLPITLDVGTNNQALLNDPFYIGLREKRITGEKYDALIEEFMRAVVRRWGPSCLIQFEDFGNANAFKLLQTYRSQYCTFNDDIQGTASVCLSGLISACRLIQRSLSDCTFLFYGAGEANLGTASLLLMAMNEQRENGPNSLRNRIWLVDSKGLVVSSRGDLSEHKRAFAQEGEQLNDLLEIIKFTKPTAIIGASAQRNAFNELICGEMAKINERPIIFALSNPTSKAECTAQQAYDWTRGSCVFASGSPFDPVIYEGRTYVTGQGNNAYIFPAVGLATIAARLHSIPEETFLVAAQALSDQLTAADTSIGLVYPRLSRVRECTLNVAARLLEYFYSERLATYRPEPSDKISYLKSIQYNPSYSRLENICPDTMARISLSNANGMNQLL